MRYIGILVKTVYSLSLIGMVRTMIVIRGMTCSCAYNGIISPVSVR